MSTVYQYQDQANPSSPDDVRKFKRKLLLLIIITVVALLVMLGTALFGGNHNAKNTTTDNSTNAQTVAELYLKTLSIKNYQEAQALTVPTSPLHQASEQSFQNLLKLQTVDYSNCSVQGVDDSNPSLAVVTMQCSGSTVNVSLTQENNAWKVYLLS